MEVVLAIRGNEGNKEGFGIGELIMAEERGQESKKRSERIIGRGGEGGNVFLSPFEEGEENRGTRIQNPGGEDRANEGRGEVCGVGAECAQRRSTGSENRRYGLNQLLRSILLRHQPLIWGRRSFHGLPILLPRVLALRISESNLLMRERERTRVTFRIAKKYKSVV